MLEICAKKELNRSAKNWTVHQQRICGECLQYLVNGEPHDHKNDQNQCDETLTKWRKEKYEPAGLNDNTEPFFDGGGCDLCNCLPCDKYLYNFFDKSNKKGATNAAPSLTE